MNPMKPSRRGDRANASTRLVPPRTQAQVVRYLQRAYQHNHVFMRMYKALAAKTQDSAQRVILSTLALEEARTALRHAKMLARHGARVPDVRDTISGQLWRMFLLRLGPSHILAWIDAVKRRDAESLARVIGHEQDD